MIVGRYAYLPSEPGLQCLDLLTGKEKWHHNEPRQQFWSSIVAAGDRLYATSKTGTTFVFAADPEGFKLLARNELDEATNATPAVAPGQLFFRTSRHLYCIEEPR